MNARHFRPNPAGVHCRRTLLSVAVLSALASMDAQAEIFTWTGNAPVYYARWVNGATTEFHQFQYYLDWLGFRNAHPDAECTAPTYWGSAGNWDQNAVPTALDQVVIPVGANVVVHHGHTLYQGFIIGAAYAGTLNSQGTINITNGCILYTNQASIAHLVGEGTVVNNGTITVASGSGTFQGTGTTSLTSSVAPNVGSTAKGGHTIKFVGVAAEGGFFTLSEQSKFINDGTLGGADIWNIGTFNPNTQSLFINTGTVNGSINTGGARLNNDGIITLATGKNLNALHNGTHTGSFTGAVGTQMEFGSFGGGTAHKFLPASSISTDGKVRFTGFANHLVEGDYRAKITEVAGYVTFTGDVSLLDKVTLQSGNASLETPGGVAVGELVLDGGYLQFNTGAPSSVTSVTLNSGGLSGGGATPGAGLTLAGPLVWNGGALHGPVTANGGIEMGAGTREFTGGTLRNSGTANWNAGGLGFGSSAVFDNPLGSVFNLKGDFSTSNVVGSGRFDNAGSLIKTAGPGIATFSPAFNNTGTVAVQAGTLRLSGGGTQSGQFSAVAGAKIELSGGHTIAGVVGTSGRVDLTDGSFAVLAAGRYTHASGNYGFVSEFSTAAGGRFTNEGTWSVSDTLTNAGTLTNAALALMTAPAGSNPGTIDNSGIFYGGYGGTFSNAGKIHNHGTFDSTLTNTGTLTNFALATLNLTDWSNTGQFDNAGTCRSYGDSDNTATGSIINTGTLTIGGSFQNKGNIANSGTLNNEATFIVQQNSSVTGPGVYRQSGGTTWVKGTGTFEALGGVFIDGGLLKGAARVIGDVYVGPFGQVKPGDSPGTLTVQGGMTFNGPSWVPAPDSIGNLEIEIANATTYDKLVVSGPVVFGPYSIIDLVFLPGFVPTDGDSFQWLSASSVQNNPNIMTRVSGLPANWSGTAVFEGNRVSIALSYDLTLPLPTSGAVIIPVGAFYRNDNSDPVYLQKLDNAGSVSNFATRSLSALELTNRAGASLSNGGILYLGSPTENAGTLRNQVGATLFLDGGFTNTGVVTNQGTLTNSGILTNAPGGRFENHGVLSNAATPSSQIVNQGDFIVAGTVTNFSWKLVGPLYNSGSIMNEGGTFIVQPGGTLNCGTGNYFQAWPGGETRVNGTLAASDITLGVGTLSGSGTLVGPVRLGYDWGGGGTVQPGNSTGTLTINGDFKGGTSEFIIELAGPADFDRLAVTGNANFNYGQVTFRLVGGYVPSSGDRFTWLTVGGAVSGLSTLNWRVEAPDGAGGFTFWGDANSAPDGKKLTFTGTGLEVSATKNFSSWLLDYFPLYGPTAAPTADPDGDGLNNAVEFVLGSNPLTVNASGGPTASLVGGNFVFTFQRAHASVHYDTVLAIEVGSTLGTWPGVYRVRSTTGWSDSGVTVTAGLTSGYDTITLTVPSAPDASKFARLRVTVTPPP